MVRRPRSIDGASPDCGSLPWAGAGPARRRIARMRASSSRWLKGFVM
jgi:hypothetical protein